MKTKEELIEQEHLLQTARPEYKEAIDALRFVIQVQIPNLIKQFPNNSDEYVDTSPLSQELFRIRLTNKPVIDSISKKSEELLKSYREAKTTKKSEDLLKSYREAITIATKKSQDLFKIYRKAIAFAYEHMASVNANNKRIGVSYEIRSKIISYVKEDNFIKLHNLLKRYNGIENIRDYYAFALRVAARGSINCLEYLISTGYANPMTPGQKSKKIALHHAVKCNRADCIQALLKAQDPNGYYCPANQLLFGVAPTRPIDFLKKAGMPSEIANIIRDVMEGPIGQGEKTSTLDRKRILLRLGDEHLNTSSCLIS